MTRQAVEEGLAQVTTRRTRKDGRMVDVELLLVPLVVDGDRTGYLLVYHDVTAVKEAETRFRRLAEELPLVTYIDAPFAARHGGAGSSGTTSTPARSARRCSDTPHWGDNTLWQSSSTRTTASACSPSSGTSRRPASR